MSCSTANAPPARCESPLLPMGDAVDSGRLSHQLRPIANRQSLRSMADDAKSYAIPDDAPAAASNSARPRSPPRDLTARLKSACRRLSPRRLARPAAPLS
ncbi:hypothetical protein GGF46_004503 [Coemansia sp. RSA 552]|nr:hypothetical protein GGF46_004503 [Coemansia sp. RSA 552]